MRLLINGKTYNTDTAHFVGLWWNGMPRTESSCCVETLYRKRTGEYFLQIAEGPDRMLSLLRGYKQIRIMKTKIMPLSRDDATAWVLQRSDPDSPGMLTTDFQDFQR